MDKQTAEKPAALTLQAFCDELDLPFETMRSLIRKNRGVKTFKIGRRVYVSRVECTRWLKKTELDYNKKIAEKQ